jgi:adenylate kinase
MQQKLTQTIQAAQTDIIVDGHYAAAVTPPNQVTHVFVLRRNPKELKAQMQKCGWPEPKISENLAAEILDSCLVEALETQKGKICELDVSAKTVEETVSAILDVVKNGKECYCGTVDWLGMLEREGILDDYLKA